MLVILSKGVILATYSAQPRTRVDNPWLTSAYILSDVYNLYIYELVVCKDLYLSPQGLDTRQDHLQVTTFIEIRGLEDTHPVHTVRLAKIHESLNVLQLQ